MGLEISQKTALNQYEIINHKSNVRLWLHDVVDEVIVPGLVTVENLIAGITLGLDQVYSASDHDHDEDYAALSHNHDLAYSAITHDHDEDYAALSHNHDTAYSALTHDHDEDYAALAHNHDTAYSALTHDHDEDYADIAHTHSIYLKSAYAAWTGNGTGAREINLSGESITTPEFIHLYAWNSTNFRLLFWSRAITTGNLFGLNHAGILQMYSVWELDGTTLDITTDLNVSSWSYRIAILGRG